MKAHRITLLILDSDGIEPDEITQLLENQRHPNHCITPQVMHIRSAEIEDWSDGHILNQPAENRRGEIQRKLYLNRLFRPSPNPPPQPPQAEQEWTWVEDSLSEPELPDFEMVAFVEDLMRGEE